MTRHLGLDLQADQASGRYKVTHVYEDGPADKDWVKVEKGNYLIAIDGKPVKAGDDYNTFLGRRLNRKVELTFNTKPVPEGAWKVKYEPISLTAFGNLRYDRWVKERRGDGRQALGRPGRLPAHQGDGSSRRWRSSRRSWASSATRKGWSSTSAGTAAATSSRSCWRSWFSAPTRSGSPAASSRRNGRSPAISAPRSCSRTGGVPPTPRCSPPASGPWAWARSIGTPTMGAVIGTGSYSLIDGSTIRTPGVGVFLADTARTNMENHAVQPDVYVENTPEDNLAGHDRQLETAVREVMKELKPGESVAKLTPSAAKPRWRYGMNHSGANMTRVYPKMIRSNSTNFRDFGSSSPTA